MTGRGPSRFRWTLLAGISFRALFGQLVTGGFLAVADEQFSMSHHRVIPRLARERLETRELFVGSPGTELEFAL